MNQSYDVAELAENFRDSRVTRFIAQRLGAAGSAEHMSVRMFQARLNSYRAQSYIEEQ